MPCPGSLEWGGGRVVGVGGGEIVGGEETGTLLAVQRKGGRGVGDTEFVRN